MRETCVRLRATILRALHSCSIVCVTVMATIFEYRDESSGESYNPSDSEPEYSTDSNGEVSESEFNGEAIPYQDEGEGWTMLSNIFQDGRPDPLMPVTDPIQGANPNILPHDFPTPGSALGFFLDEYVVTLMCSLSNEREFEF